MTSPITTAPPVPAATPAAVQTRRSPWPYAGVVSAIAFGAATTFLAVGPGAYVDPPSPMTTEFLAANLSPASTILIGGGLALLGLAASLVFLIGLTRFHARYARPRSAGLVEALRWSAIAFVAIGAIGVGIRYIAAGGAPGGIDLAFYPVEASAVLALLADQLLFAVFLPGLAVMAVVGLLAVRDRVLPMGVGIVALVLAAGSTAATLALGLPYSSGLVWPLFALVVGVTGMFVRRPA